MGLPSFSSFGGHVKRCAVYIRGRRRCVWCKVRLEDTKDATVDHYDGDHWNNDPTNLLSSCRVCNWERACSSFREYLIGKGVRLEKRLEIAERQLSRPLPDKSARKLAELWYPKRKEQLRRARAKYAAKIKEREAERRAQAELFETPEWVTEPATDEMVSAVNDLRPDIE